MTENVTKCHIADGQKISRIFVKRKQLKIYMSDEQKTDKSNPFGLSPEELRVLHKWQRGLSMQEAYSEVMLSMYEKKSIKQGALARRVNRFFDTYRMREAMAATPGNRGEVAKRKFEQWKINHRDEEIKRFAGNEGLKRMKVLIPYNGEKTEGEDERYELRKEMEEKAKEELSRQRQLLEEEYEEKYKDRVARDKEKWLESLNINATPDAMTVYGTGQFLAYVAVKEIFARQNALRAQGISVLDKNGSALTPLIVNALKTAAAMILPFAPAPSAEDRKQMSKAAVLLGLMPEDISEDPDEYTAPAPVPIDVGED